MHVFVETTSMCLSEERSDEQYGPWYRDNMFTVDRVTLTKPSGYSYETFDVDAEFKRGDTVYVLSIHYSSGDSFGNEDGLGEVLWVFKNELIAKEALARWQHACGEHLDYFNREKQQFCTFRVDGGQYKKLNNPAFGYFESVDAIKLTAFVVQ